VDTSDLNIFATSPCPLKSALALDDRRVQKMVVESAQLLSCAVLAGTIKTEGRIYKITHQRHPCAVWVQSSAHAAAWLLEHALWLSVVYTMVHSKEHRTYTKVLSKMEPLADPNPLSLPNCTTYKEVKCVHEAYRQYMVDKWSTGATWKKRGPPSWLQSTPKH